MSATGQWELPLSGVADGKHAYKAYATDKATGQNSGWSHTRTVNVVKGTNDNIYPGLIGPMPIVAAS